MKFIATFYTQAAALLTDRRLKKLGIVSAAGPVPRELSSSCGTCVHYNADDAMLNEMDTDVESVYAVTDQGYRELHHRD